MKTSKAILIIMVLSISGLSLIYSIPSFYYLDIDLRNWSGATRAGTAVFSILYLIFLTIGILFDSELNGGMDDYEL